MSKSDRCKWCCRELHSEAKFCPECNQWQSIWRGWLFQLPSWIFAGLALVTGLISYTLSNNNDHKMYLIAERIDQIDSLIASCDKISTSESVGVSMAMLNRCKDFVNFASNVLADSRAESATLADANRSAADAMFSSMNQKISQLQVELNFALAKKFPSTLIDETE